MVQESLFRDLSGISCLVIQQEKAKKQSQDINETTETLSTRAEREAVVGSG